MKKDKEWDGICKCKHKHSEHNNKPPNLNYTAGKCKKNCHCKAFVHNPQNI